MSKYNFKIADYHAIREADIEINGITVLSGINGCGKSTLSRWLYYLVNGANQFDNFLFDDYKNKLRSLVNRMQFACRDLVRFRHINNQADSFLDTLNETAGKLKSIDVLSIGSIELAQELFLQALYATENVLTIALAENLPLARLARVFSFLQMKEPNENISQTIEDFSERNRRLVTNLTQKLHQNMEKHPARIFFESLNSHFEIKEEKPSILQFEEDNVSIVEEDHISTLFNLQRAIYIDTPMFINAGSTGNLFWNASRKMMLDEQDKNLSVEERKLLIRIKHLLDGEAILKKEEIFDERNLRYVSTDKKVNIDLSEAATGFKTFSYLQLLLENGYLNSETLLMIDEPEAHLHPQWIVEFAHLLVLLHKELDVKVMIASHNPDMVAAIHDIAQKQGVLNNTNFYVAQQESVESHKYIYQNLEHEIGEIFESFNIALENIKRYGANGTVGIQ